MKTTIKTLIGAFAAAMIFSCSDPEPYESKESVHIEFQTYNLDGTLHTDWGHYFPTEVKSIQTSVNGQEFTGFSLHADQGFGPESVYTIDLDFTVLNTDGDLAMDDLTGQVYPLDFCSTWEDTCNYAAIPESFHNIIYEAKIGMSSDGYADSIDVVVDFVEVGEPYYESYEGVTYGYQDVVLDIDAFYILDFFKARAHYDIEATMALMSNQVTFD